MTGPRTELIPITRHPLLVTRPSSSVSSTSTVSRPSRWASSENVCMARTGLLRHTIASILSKFSCQLHVACDSLV